MELEDVILTEVTQTQEEKCHAFSPIGRSQSQIFRKKKQEVKWDHCQDAVIKEQQRMESLGTKDMARKKGKGKVIREGEGSWVK